MLRPNENDPVSLPPRLLRRRRHFRLRRRNYRELPSAEGADALLRERLDEAIREKEDWMEKAARAADLGARARADLENFRRRVQKEREELRHALTADVLASFLIVLEHFDLALQAADSSPDPRAVLDGVHMIHRELIGVLESLGIEKINAVGVQFNPAIHEAVATESVPDAPPHAVVAVLRPGWKYRERCLRAAMVKVNNPAEPLSPKPAPRSPESPAPASAPEESAE